MKDYSYLRNDFEKMNLSLLKDIVENKKHEYEAEVFQIAIDVLEKRTLLNKETDSSYEFLKEVKEMTENDILLALEEQIELYSKEEIQILKKELAKKQTEKKEQTFNVHKDNYTPEYKGNPNVTITDNNNVVNRKFWTEFLRTILIINFVCGIIVGLFLWYILTEITDNGLLGFIMGAVFVLFTMVSTSSIMIFVEMSENVSKILEISQNKK